MNAREQEEEDDGDGKTDDDAIEETPLLRSAWFMIFLCNVVVFCVSVDGVVVMWWLWC